MSRLSIALFAGITPFLTAGLSTFGCSPPPAAADADADACAPIAVPSATEYECDAGRPDLGTCTDCDYAQGSDTCRADSGSWPVYCVAHTTFHSLCSAPDECCADQTCTCYPGTDGGGDWGCNL